MRLQESSIVDFEPVALRTHRTTIRIDRNEDPTGTGISSYVTDRMHKRWQKSDRWRAKMHTAGLIEQTQVELPRQYWEFMDVFQVQKMESLPPHRGDLDHGIDLIEGKDVPNMKAYSMSLGEERYLKDHVTTMQARGFIRKSKSSGGAPVVFAAKKDTHELRVCIDYRGLNKITVKNRYPLPLLDSLIDKVAGARYFTKLDLIEAYYLIRIRKGDEYKTAFKTPFGLFEYLVIPFGLCNAPATFQAFIDRVLADQLNTELIAYLDDILIFGDTLEELQARTTRCLAKLREAGLFVKLSKCVFEAIEVPFLGYIITSSGLKMDPERIAAITEWPTPRKIRYLQ